jgi:hypothetical protein
MDHLKRLDLRKNYIGLRGFTILTDAIGDMMSLQEILLVNKIFTIDLYGMSIYIYYLFFLFFFPLFVFRMVIHLIRLPVLVGIVY